MIKVNKIPPPTFEAFDPNGQSLGFLNDFEFNDLRIQIKKEQAEGYYMIFGNYRLSINKNGQLDYWPKGFYDMFDTQLFELLGLIDEKKP